MASLIQIGNFIFDLDKFESAHYSKFPNSLHIKIDKEEYMFVYEEAEEMFNQLKELTKNENE
jgi:hypothetical protein